ncbi:hypothetical protein F5887DRAFT_973867 [Amanita rubescens]|nr:hypothetical protein F5887DRAFT_973867 [Amanita rubescens]
MVWHADNLNLRDRAMQLAFDIRKLQRSAREKLVPVERLEQKKQTADQVDKVVAANGARDFPDLQRRLFGTLTPQERVMYERVSVVFHVNVLVLDAYMQLVERLLPIGQTVDPTLDVYSILFLFTHLVATMRDYARAFAGKSALAPATQSAKLVNEIIQNEDKLVAIAGLDPDPWQISSEQVQKERLKVAVHELYLRRLASLFFERLCDAIMPSSLTLAHDSCTTAYY